MAENAQGGEKTEDPTPKKLEDARNEGQVAFSAEVNTAILLLIGFATLGVMGTGFCRAASSSMVFCIRDALTWELTEQMTLRSMAAHLAPMALWMLPFLGVTVGAALVVSFAQVGFHLTAKPLMPQFNKVSPLTGFGRLFGTKGLIRFATNLMKLILLVTVAYLVISRDLPHFAELGNDLGARFAGDGNRLLWLAIKLSAVLFIVAGVDYLFQRWQHHQDMMMTKQEVKDEFKQSEGDPLVKGKIRQIQRQMAQKRMMQEVPKADVVITNPTHVAVALKYDQGKMNAPIVIAKGYDEVAQRIKAIAKEHGITLVEDVPLARALAKDVPIGKPIPTKWFNAVAQVLSQVYKLKGKTMAGANPSRQ